MRTAITLAAATALAAGIGLSGRTLAQPAAAGGGDAAVYQANCASCHGATLKGGAGPALIAAHIANAKPAALAQQIKASMPIYAPGSLSDAQYAAVTRYVLAQNAAAKK